MFVVIFITISLTLVTLLNCTFSTSAFKRFKQTNLKKNPKLHSYLNFETRLSRLFKTSMIFDWCNLELALNFEFTAVQAISSVSILRFARHCAVTVNFDQFTQWGSVRWWHFCASHLTTYYTHSGWICGPNKELINVLPRNFNERRRLVRRKSSFQIIRM